MAGKRINKCLSLGRHRLRFIRILVLVSLSAFLDDSTVCNVRCSCMPVGSREETMTGLCYL